MSHIFISIFLNIRANLDERISIFQIVFLGQGSRRSWSDEPRKV